MAIRQFIFDIETGPSAEQSLFIEPYPEFDPDSVKVGNTKDPEKVKTKVREAGIAHELGREPYYEKATEKLLLKSYASVVEAIGICIIDHEGNETEYYLTSADLTEKAILEKFWELMSEFDYAEAHLRKIVGFNIKEFDLPFIIQRSWKYKLHIPWATFCANSDPANGRFYYDNIVVDLMQLYTLGSFRNGFVGLGKVCQHLFGEGKDEAIKATDFWKEIRTDDMAKVERAIDYLRRDVYLTKKLAEVLLNY